MSATGQSGQLHCTLTYKKILYERLLQLNIKLNRDFQE